MEITVDGVVYVPKVPPKTRRCFVVIDRGWLFAGDVEDYTDPVSGHRILIHNAVWVFGWEKVGLTAVLEDHRKADIRPLPDNATEVDFPGSTEIYRIPVPDGWGVRS